MQAVRPFGIPTGTRSSKARDQRRALFESPQGTSLRDPRDEKTSRVVGSHQVEQLQPSQAVAHCQAFKLRQVKKRLFGSKHHGA